jgi:hypothetical protein
MLDLRTYGKVQAAPLCERSSCPFPRERRVWMRLGVCGGLQSPRSDERSAICCFYTTLIRVIRKPSRSANLLPLLPKLQMRTPLDDLLIIAQETAPRSERWPTMKRRK